MAQIDELFGFEKREHYVVPEVGLDRKGSDDESEHLEKIAHTQIEAI